MCRSKCTEERQLSDLQLHTRKTPVCFSGCPAALVKFWLRMVKVKVSLSHRADGRYASLLQGCNSFRQYATWQLRPRLHHVVSGPSIAAYRARYWGWARCCHHPCADGRAWTNSPCRFCACGVDSLAHAVLERPAHSILRQRWKKGGPNGLDMH